jgi:hypothetical protein
MDRFVDSQVPVPGRDPPVVGVVSFGVADYSAADNLGYSGTTDPTFAGLSLNASSPFECNEKASHIAVEYNKFRERVDGIENYEVAYKRYETRCKTECNCGDRFISAHRENLAYELCVNDMRAGKFIGNTDMCGTHYKGAFWVNGTPEKPRKDTPLDALYTAQEIALYTAVGQQTINCISSGCSFSLSPDNLPAVTNLAWTFFSSPADAPFGTQCQVHLRKSNKLAPNQNALTGTGNYSDLGRRALATVPYKRNDCAPSKVGLTTTECTALTTKLTAEKNHALAWWYSLPDNSQSDEPSKTGEINRICQDYDVPDVHSLSECACQNAENSEAFTRLKSNFSTTTKLCWYSPCAVKGIDRLLTPDDIKARDACNADVCQNIINGLDNQGLDFNDVKMSVNCSSAEVWDKIAPENESVRDSTNIISGATQKLGELVSGVDWASVAGAIVAGVVILLLLAAAMWLWSSPRPLTFSAAAALAPATVTAKTVVPVAASAAVPRETRGQTVTPMRSSPVAAPLAPATVTTKPVVPVAAPAVVPRETRGQTVTPMRPSQVLAPATVTTKTVVPVAARAAPGQTAVTPV